MTKANGGSGGVQRTASDVGLLIIRLMLGVVFMFHGSQKLFGWFDGPGIQNFAGFLDTQLHVPMPQLSAWLAALAEFGGGVILVLGLFMRVLIIPTIFTMGVAVYAVHGNGFSVPTGVEFPLTLACMLTGLVLTGPGRITVTSLFRGAKSHGARVPPGG